MKKSERIKFTELLEMLNKNLKDELTTYIQNRSLKYFFLNYKHEKFCKILMSLITEELMTPHENLFKEDDQSSKIYFINKGSIIIYDEITSLIYKKLEENTNFGEIGFFSQKKRLTSADSCSFVNLSYINFESFQEAMRQFKEKDYKIYQTFKYNLREIRTKFRRRQYEGLYINCYMCDKTDHLAQFCETLLDKENCFKCEFKGNQF